MAKEKKRAMQISRRQFVKGAAVGAVAVTAAGAVGVLSSCGTPETGLPDKWDKEVDVIVVGTGTANAAALYAHDAGLEVLMLEKAPVFGGTTAISGGGLFLPVNYLLQEQENSIDSRAKAITFMTAISSEQSNSELINAFVDNANPMMEWFRDNVWENGVEWQRLAGNAVMGFGDYYPFEGTLGAITRAVDISRPDGVIMGAGLIKSCREAVDARGIEIMLETPAKRLLYKGDSNNGDGEVIGVIAEDPNGQEIAIKARRGVCLGTGGFDHNREMVRHFLRFPLRITCGVPHTNTGDGHLMAMAVGADLRNMNECWNLVGYLPTVPPSVGPLPTGLIDWGLQRGKPGAIVVNRYGERIGNESAAYENFGRAMGAWDSGKFEWRNVPSFTIFDSGYTSRYGLPAANMLGVGEVGEVPDWMTTADTLDGLAAALGIDATRLAGTVERFNGYASSGVDPDYHRGEAAFDRYSAGDILGYEAGDIAHPCLAPIENPPYYGAKLWTGALGTHGGPRTNGNAQVLNVWGNVIPRLYASGNCMASVMGAGYAGGGATLGPGFTFGYIAGKHVATLASWE